MKILIGWTIIKMNSELEKIQRDVNLAYFYIFLVMVSLCVVLAMVITRIDKLEKKLKVTSEKVVDQSIKP